MAGETIRSRAALQGRRDMNYLRAAVRGVLLAVPWITVLLCYPLLIIWLLGVPGNTDAGQGTVVAVILTAVGSIAVYVLLMIVLALLGATGLLARLSGSRVGVAKAAMIAFIAFVLVQVACFALMLTIYG